MPIGQFFVFFLLLLTGFFCSKYNVLTDAAVSSINKFILTIAMPCLILSRTTALDMDNRIFANFLLVFIIYVGTMMLYAAYARFYCRGKRFSKEDRPVLELAMISPNNGFIGFPVAITFFGNLGLLYMVGTNIAMNTVSFTYGIAILKRDRDQEGEPARQKLLAVARFFADPKICAAIAGIILCYNHVVLPEIAEDFLGIVGDTASPIAMISIGTMLAGTFGPQAFKSRSIMEPVLNKLFVIPAATAAIVWFLPLDPLVKTILIVANALPVAAVVAIQAEQFGRNKDIASAAIVISTIFSMATIPLIIGLLHQTSLIIL